MLLSDVCLMSVYRVAHVTRDSDTTFKVKKSKVKVTGGGGILWRPPAQLIIIIITLRASEAAAQCIVIAPVSVFVCGSVTTITRNCVHRSSTIKLIKFWPSRAPREGGLRRGEIFGSALL